VATDLLPTNRKYLGSKRHLAPRICDRICARGVPESLLDGFCGTGAIAVEMARRGTGALTGIDTLLSNTLVLAAHFSPVVRHERVAVAELIEQLGRAEPRNGYVTDAFGDRYFTLDNARRIDAARAVISGWHAAAAHHPELIDATLGALLLAADRVANCIGQYDAYLKHLGSDAYQDGRHLVDSRVYGALQLVPVASSAGSPATVRVVTADINEVIAHVDVEIAYFDPPYNGRQYSDNYHVLESIARWDDAPVYGKTRKARRPLLKSAFSRRREVEAALRRLLQGCRARRIYLSYSSEGLLGENELWPLLREFGSVERFSFDYPVFGNGAGVARRRQVVEHLYELQPHAA
jgi:adenine-specific DNA-methyltransferase